MTVCPVEQYRILKALSDPSLLASPKSRNKRQATMSPSTDYTSNAFAKPMVYISRKQGELPIVIDSGASYSVTPTLEDFMGPIEPCSTSELNGLNVTIKEIRVGTVE
jgi:hypothetical protein